MDKLLSRRYALKTMGMSAAAITAVNSGLGKSAFSKDKLPNIVYIMADDMGYGDLSCQNSESKIPTPNMNCLAREGMRFTNAHSGSSVCTPTRYGVLTGRYCWRTRLKSHVLWPYDPPLIERERLTVASLLKQYGYATACIGKWHLGAVWTLKDGSMTAWENRALAGLDVDFSKPVKGGPTVVGFDYYYGMTGSANYPPYCFVENDRTVGIPAVPKPKEMFGTDGMMLPGWKHEDVLPALTRKSVGYIETHVGNNKDKPFFLYFPLTAPHTPVAPADFVKGRSGAGKYGDFVAEIDWTVGEIMRTLNRLGIVENTLLILTSDNGSPARTSGWDKPYTVVEKYGHNPSGILHGIKADIWDGGHRVPFITRWPKKIKSGSISNELICHTDLLATVAAIIGDSLPNDSGEDSYNILPALLDQKSNKPIREAIVHHSLDGMFAIRQGPWKLILGRGSGGFTQPRRIEPEPGEPEGQLYNMDDDLKETKNLYQDRPDIVNHLTELLEKYKKQGYSHPIKTY